jgi:hypothetical protein
MTEKTRERLALEYEVADLISALSVHMHYTASATAARRGQRLYAVFQRPPISSDRAVQLTEPTSHAQAQADLRRIVAERICDLFEARQRP